MHFAHTQRLPTTKALLYIYLTLSLFLFIQAIFVAPWPEGVLKRTVHELLQSLHDSKMSVAESIHFQYLRSRQLEAASAPLLAFCFGNRSAVLYELGKIEVHMYIRM